MFIHLSEPSNCTTEFIELMRTPSRKYIYFWKAMINTVAKRILVQLCYYMTREFSSTFSRESTAKRQFLQKSASNLLKSRSAVSVKENTILTESALLLVFTFDENSSPFRRFLDYSYWPVRDLELVLRDAANVHTGKKKTVRLFKSDGP